LESRVVRDTAIVIVLFIFNIYILAFYSVRIWVFSGLWEGGKVGRTNLDFERENMFTFCLDSAVHTKTIGILSLKEEGGKWK